MFLYGEASKLGVKHPGQEMTSCTLEAQANFSNHEESDGDSQGRSLLFWVTHKNIYH